jgi:acetolactate synthase I/II/III large subunit
MNDIGHNSRKQPAIDVPVAGTEPATAWGSDAIADVLRALDIPYVALNPGASFRGLHDSLVNHLGNRAPRMLLCLHEEHAVAIAHGYAKVTGKPLAAIVHSNVGLMHGTMAIFNAWCDRVPVIVIGATGPVDAAKRRPWIDWIHTAQDQAALIRWFIKWDNQPASVAAAQEALLRAAMLAQTAPRGPVYINLDAALQEQRLDALPPVPEVARYRPPPPAEPAATLIAQATQWLAGARKPVIMMGRVSRDFGDWQARVALAETLGAAVLTETKTPVAFPTGHPLHGPPATFLSGPSAELLRSADVILSLDWVDLAGALRTAWEGRPVSAKIIQVSVDQHNHNGWSMDHFGLPPVDLFLLNEPGQVVPPLLAEVRKLRPSPPQTPPRAEPAAPPVADAESISVPLLARTLRAVLNGADACLIRVPLSWGGNLWPFAHPLDYLGGDGGGGVGAGPGMAVGAALALKGTGRLPIAMLGDGDYLMGVTALWTAVHNQIPLLVVIANNRSYFNDEIHQERMARQRNRPVENKWIGQAIREPDIDLAALGRAQGAAAFGPVEQPARLAGTLADAIAAVRAGQLAVVDVRVLPGYETGTTTALTREAKHP